MKLLIILLRRLRDGVIVLWAAASLTFLGMQHSGGDTALAILGGPDAMPSEALLAQVRAEYGLDQPLWVQYGHYQAIGEQAAATLALASSAAVLAVLLAVASALLTACLLYTSPSPRD